MKCRSYKLGLSFAYVLAFVVGVAALSSANALQARLRQLFGDGVEVDWHLNVAFLVAMALVGTLRLHLALANEGTKYAREFDWVANGILQPFVWIVVSRIAGIADDGVCIVFIGILGVFATIANAKLDPVCGNVDDVFSFYARMGIYAITWTLWARAVASQTATAQQASTLVVVMTATAIDMLALILHVSSRPKINDGTKEYIHELLFAFNVLVALFCAIVVNNHQ